MAARKIGARAPGKIRFGEGTERWHGSLGRCLSWKDVLPNGQAAGRYAIEQFPEGGTGAFIAVVLDAVVRGGPRVIARTRSLRAAQRACRRHHREEFFTGADAPSAAGANGRKVGKRRAIGARR